MKKYLLCALASTAFLIGCAPTVWVKPDAKDMASEFRTADYECEKDSRQSSFGNGLSGALAMKEFYNKCMISKGWQIKK